MSRTEYKIHGTTDEITVCDCCGKPNLRATVVLEVLEGDNAGDLLHFGSHCAARALGRKKSHADVIVAQAKRAQKLAPVAAAVKAAIALGIEAARDAGRAKAQELGLDKEVKVSGYESWGCINIDGFYSRQKVHATA